ncbi:MAG TPA: hypothetical protein VFW44_07275, partial [Bryobacteraceae bacterium]|nr:hypothetical protein [Bryobacteraceae bacterium]
PGTFLRMGANSAIRMLSNKLEDTRVELLRGSAIVDQSSDTLADTAVTVLFNLDQVQIQQPGTYRFDSAPPQLKVEKGQAQVTADGKSIQVDAGYAVPFDGKLVARKLLNDSGAGSRDELDTWAEARNHSVDQNNQEAAATSDLSGVIDGWNNNPDSVLQSLGIPPYIPGMSSAIPPPGYGTYGSGSYGLYTPGLYGPEFYGSPLYFSSLYPYSLYGVGAINPLLLYGSPLYRPYGAYNPNRIYRGLPLSHPGLSRGVVPGLGTGRVGYGYGGYGAPRPVIGVRPSVGIGIGAGRIGGVGIGAGHVGVGGGHLGGHR